MKNQNKKTKNNIAVIGCGIMGSMIIKLLKKLNYKVLGLDKGDDINQAKFCNIVILAVKPQDFKNISNLELNKDTLVVSIMAGISVANIKKQLKVNKIVRAMPNTPVQIGKGFVGYFTTPQVSTTDKEFINQLFNKMGINMQVSKEDDINKITAISGSGPAYIFHTILSFINGAKDLGIKEKDAKNMVLQTIIGSLAMIDEDTNIEELMKNVTSKGGTTEAGLKVFNTKNTNQIWKNAINSAYKRAKELSK